MHGWSILYIFFYLSDFSVILFNVSILPLAKILIRADQSVRVSDSGPVSSLVCVFIVGVALWKMTAFLPEIKFRNGGKEQERESPKG